jgi:hypothetical protein
MASLSLHTTSPPYRPQQKNPSPPHHVRRLQHDSLGQHDKYEPDRGPAEIQGADQAAAHESSHMLGGADRRQHLGGRRGGAAQPLEILGRIHGRGQPARPSAFRAQESSDLQADRGMARPGLEPGTPRFSGSRSSARLLRKDLQKRRFLVLRPRLDAVASVRFGARLGLCGRVEVLMRVPLPRSRCGAGNGRTIAWSGHDDEFSSRDQSLTAKHTAQEGTSRCRA